jgi:hypothetical protein
MIKMPSTISEERKVIAMISPLYLHNKETDTFAARITPLGLTAYGNSQDEATRKVKRMFASAVAAHRSKGDLEDWLSESGLEWHWLDEYDGDTPVEDAWVTGERQPKFARDLNPVRWQGYNFVGVAA